jgi:hypothetical protein
VPSPLAVITVEPIVSNASSPIELDRTVSNDPSNCTPITSPESSSVRKPGCPDRSCAKIVNGHTPVSS